MKEYDHKKIEKKWQTAWDKSKIYEAKSSSPKATADSRKFYGLIEFPYPSGSGLHVGHIRSNTAMDVISRKRRMEGYNVLYPIGWDAFGLPTENYAIKSGIHPIKVTKQNTDTFRKQLKSLGFSFDWSREVNTTDPKYYKWTQWIFLQMFKKGLAYKKRTEINWCPSCKIGLANEEVVGGMCDRCGGPTEKREKEQWMLAITKYADRLDKDLDDVDYLEKIKIQQRNWIGKSEGAEIDFAVGEHKITVFTTRPDTIFGATYMVLAPEHEMVAKLKSQITNWSEVEKYIQEVKNKDDIERTAENKEKTGVELKGIKAINPATKQEIPVWIADYVLVHYGTGAIMAVPGHDERDFEFAKKYKLPIKQVVLPIYTDANNPHRAGKENTQRNIVQVILRNNKNEILIEFLKDKKWEDLSPKTFIIGGIENGETALEAAAREIKEETGYVNFKFIEKIPFEFQSNFFAAHKDVNRTVHVDTLVFDLLNEEKIEITEDEYFTKDSQEIKWIPDNKVLETLSTEDQRLAWKYFKNGGFSHNEKGIIINSGKFDGLNLESAKKEIIKFVGGKEKTTYKLRDWVFSRQRYWGEPIPLINCEKCGFVAVPDKDLPVKLPNVAKYKPTDNGESPLADIKTWVNVKCPQCKGKAKRETDTMPNWAGSSWYYLRYADTKNNKEFASKRALDYWLDGGVDWYNGGMEHTTLHLLYSRFWHKFLYDLKLVPTSEPYAKRTSHGMILASDGAKISKSKGNGIDPMDIIKIYGADAVRMYEMFMGPFDQSAPWDTNGIVGPYRFLERVWKLSEKISKSSHFSVVKSLNRTIKKVTEDIELMRFNTAISSMMILSSEMEKVNFTKEDYKKLLQILAPFAPHITEELWSVMGAKKSIHVSGWPKWEESLIAETEVKIIIQVNGKVRAEMMSAVDASEEEVKKNALSNEAVVKYLSGGEPKKVIYVKGRLINIVI